MHRRMGQDFLRGALFSSKNWRSFLLVVLNTLQAKTAKLAIPTLKLSPPRKKHSSKKFTSCSAWGSFTTYPYILRPISSPPGGRTCNHCSAPLATPMGLCNVRRLSICLPVFLSEILRKNYWTDFRENFTTKLWTKNWLNFGSYPLPGEFLKDSLTLQGKALFHSLDHISGNAERIFVKMLPQMYPWTSKFPLNFARHADIHTPDLDQIRLGGGMSLRVLFS